MNHLGCLLPAAAAAAAAAVGCSVLLEVLAASTSLLEASLQHV
jgi:hypothetical protein